MVFDEPLELVIVSHKQGGAHATRQCPLLTLSIVCGSTWQCAVCVLCVFYYCRTYYKAVRVGGGGEWRTCAMRDDEPRPVWMRLPITH